MPPAGVFGRGLRIARFGIIRRRREGRDVPRRWARTRPPATGQAWSRRHLRPEAMRLRVAAASLPSDVPRPTRTRMRTPPRRHRSLRLGLLGPSVLKVVVATQAHRLHRVVHGRERAPEPVDVGSGEERTYSGNLHLRADLAGARQGARPLRGLPIVRHADDEIF